jgi:hypothetical protein
LISYNELTGEFFNRKSGKKLTAKNRGGYLVMSYKKKSYLCHRLAWLYVYGSYPKNVIDHINRVRDDNRISNLRDVTYTQNALNKTHKALEDFLKSAPKSSRKWELSNENNFILKGC